MAFPTETVYGLGADAWNGEAIRKVFSMKGRPADNPLIVHVASIQMAEAFAKEIPAGARTLIEIFWPGPLTLVFKKKEAVLDVITGGLDTVAVRMPDHPLALSLIRSAGPLVAPSANRSGKPSPTRPGHVLHDFGPDLPVINGGPCRIGLESTVVDVTTNPFRVYRPGFVSRSQIEEIIQAPVEVYRPERENEKARSPGLKYTHYSPNARVRWLAKDEHVARRRAVYLLHSRKYNLSGSNVVYYDSQYDRFAGELYDRFRQADLKGMDEVVIEPFPELLLNIHPLLPALINRINKAIGEERK